MSTADAEQSNYVKAGKILIELGTDILRDVLANYVPASDINTKWHQYRNLAIQKRTRNHFNLLPKESRVLNNVSSVGNYSECDITLLYKLIRCVSGIQPPGNGWGTHGGVDVSDDVEKIREYRNQIYGHLPRPRIPQNMYQSLLHDMRNVCQRFDRRTIGAFGTYEERLKTIDIEKFTTTKKRHPLHIIIIATSIFCIAIIVPVIISIQGVNEGSVAIVLLIIIIVYCIADHIYGLSRFRSVSLALYLIHFATAAESLLSETVQRISSRILGKPVESNLHVCLYNIQKYFNDNKEGIEELEKHIDAEFEEAYMKVETHIDAKFEGADMKVEKALETLTTKKKKMNQTESTDIADKEFISKEGVKGRRIWEYKEPPIQIQ